MRLSFKGAMSGKSQVIPDAEISSELQGWMRYHPFRINARDYRMHAYTKKKFRCGMKYEVYCL